MPGTGTSGMWYVWSPCKFEKVKSLFLHRAAHQILYSSKLKNEVTNRKGKKGPFLNLKKTRVIDGLMAIPNEEKIKIRDLFVVDRDLFVTIHDK